LAAAAIRSRRNALVQQLRKTAERRAYREQTGLAFIEGARLVEEALLAGAAMHTLCFSEGFDADSPRGARLKSLAARVDHVVALGDEIMAYVCETVAPQGVAALVRIPRAGLDAVLGAMPMDGIELKKYRRVLVLDGVSDPGNAGTMARTAHAAGFDAIVSLDGGGVDFWSPKTLRASMGALFHIPVVSGVPAEECLRALKRRGFRVYAAAAGGERVCYEDGLFRRHFALVVGGEAEGVREGVLRAVRRARAHPHAGRRGIAERGGRGGGRDV